MSRQKNTIKKVLTDDYGRAFFSNLRRRYALNVVSANWIDRLFYRDVKYKAKIVFYINFNDYTDSVMYFKSIETLENFINNYENYEG